ncbi:alpha-1-acid glycoprotein-like [Talpa occidentalis]|uniref:alpha-1-acid glycoprotein-like n=1 Tax=Talpa occidentalis TaxID=50954 RepID=UPI00188EF9CB|nr:alpha-1-acid glycoprotein-like [Talpa occidentalis]
MALPWALAVLSLLPLLSAQSPECANFTAKPITNVTLDWLSGKWFYVAGIFRHPLHNQSARSVPSAFAYFAPNHTEDKIYTRVYQTVGDRCIYNSSQVVVHRKNGTMFTKALTPGPHLTQRFSPPENDTEYHTHLLLSKNPRTFMLSFFPEDKQKMGIAIYSDKPHFSEEQLNEFHEVIECMGMHKSEIILSDEKKDQCGPLEKQHEEERKKEQEGAKEE